MKERRGRCVCRRLCEGAGWRRFEEKHGEAITPFRPNYRGCGGCCRSPLTNQLGTCHRQSNVCNQAASRTGRPAASSRMLTGCSSAKAATTATATTIASLPRRARTTSKPGAMARCAFFCGAVSIDACSCSSGSSSGVPVFEGCLPRPRRVSSQRRRMRPCSSRR